MKNQRMRKIKILQTSPGDHTDMDNGDGKNREGIEMLHEENSQSALFAERETESYRTAPPCRSNYGF